MISDKIKGCIFGYAIGDALGLGTEFMTRPEALHRYNGGLRNYSQIIRDAHRSQWRNGDYTGDTQILARVIESMIATGEVDHLDFARRLRTWYLSNEDNTDLGTHIRIVLKDPEFEKNPEEVSNRAMTTQGFFEARNESLGRALAIGLWPVNVEKNVTANTLITHHDSRCVACGVIIATMANELLWHRREADFDLLIGIAKRLDNRVTPYLEIAREGTLAELNLDDEDTSWYTRKTMAAALWALWHNDNPEDALYQIVDEAGDADTNAALAMGLLGLKYGFNAMPMHHVNGLLNHDRLDDLIQRAIPVIIEAGHRFDAFAEQE